MTADKTKKAVQIIADGKAHKLTASGHHYRIEADGSMTLWDDSGEVVYLSRTGPIHVHHDCVFVAVLDKKGRKCSTPMSLAAAIAIAQHYDIPVVLERFPVDVKTIMCRALPLLRALGAVRLGENDRLSEATWRQLMPLLNQAGQLAALVKF